VTCKFTRNTSSWEAAVLQSTLYFTCSEKAVWHLPLSSGEKTVVESWWLIVLNYFVFMTSFIGYQVFENTTCPSGEVQAFHLMPRKNLVRVF